MKQFRFAGPFLSAALMLSFLTFGSQQAEAQCAKLCPLYEWADWGAYKSYYGMDCAAGMPLNIDGDFGPNPYSDCMTCANNCFIAPSMAPKSRPMPKLDKGQKAAKICCQGTVQTVAFQEEENESGRKQGHAYKNPKYKKSDGDNPTGNAPSHIVRKPLGRPISVKFVVSGVFRYAKVRLFSVEVKEFMGRPAHPIQIFAVGQEVKTPGNPAKYHPVIDEQVDVSPDGQVARLALGSVTYQVVLDDGA